MPEIEVTPEHAADPLTRRVGILVGVVGILLSVVTIASHRAHTEAVIHRTESNDQWAFYQAKNIRRHTDELFVDLTSVEATTDAAVLAKLREKYSGEAARYKEEQKGIEEKANEMEAEVGHERNRADRFDLAEVFLEVGLVITSITLLSGRQIFWYLGMLLGVVGIVVAGTAFFVH